MFHYTGSNLLLCSLAQHTVLKSLMLVFVQALGMDTWRCCGVCCALNDYEPVAGYTVYSLCVNTAVE